MGKSVMKSKDIWVLARGITSLLACDKRAWLFKQELQLAM
jgi:hypothetical protein